LFINPNLIFCAFGNGTPKGPENEEEEQETDEELIKSVDARYYTPDLDPVEELFNQLPPNFDEQWLTREIKRRERQRELLAASLADRVIKSYSAFGTKHHNTAHTRHTARHTRHTRQTSGV
jgi:hypothetical protein